MGTLAAQLSTQVGKTAGQISTTLLDRLFKKRDRTTAYQESGKYMKRNEAYEQRMAEYNQNLAEQTAKYNQGLSKEYFDYTAAYETPKEQMKRLNEAGLNPGLLYSNGQATGQGGQTGGAQAAPVRADAPQEQFKGMGMPTTNISEMAMRETPAERELKLAQAENLRSETGEREGVGKSLKEAQTASILEGINNDKARTALTKAQEIATNLENQITEATMDDTIDMVSWATKSAKKQYEIAEDEAYISSETREEKIEILRNTLYLSVIEANLKKATISHIGKEDQKINEEIKRISTDILDTYHQWSNKSKEIRLEHLKYELDVRKTDLQEIMTQYQGAGKVAGRILDKAMDSIYKGVGAIDNLLGTPTVELDTKWR